ncbi:DUF3467 domain-containing protein [Bradyrhizobium amphicarpaeae]|uniref:DUF3467 domain-containing protein n=1 Tax=Bradyrhizobium amphicarpaeae TaxID=1404768 RepID=A0A2U8PQP1_9BRAD|nr:DUF3467 domain-containing protein [Bradyrhizobium amphicarpaeae]AWL99960.1 DUF3467 domain-containing protein [Bradyrhizobium amphicarpaeae]
MSNEKDTPNSAGQPSSTAAAAPAQPGIKVDTSALKSSYCNVVSGNSTREEVVLSFGVNQDWDMGPQPREIQLHHRIILSPGAAKRLLELMTKLVHDHEARHGEIR